MARHAEIARKSAPPPSPDSMSTLSDATSQRLNQRPAVVAQRAAADRLSSARAPNRTGLPSQLKSGVEALSGVSLDDVRVHRNSPEPAQLQAHAFAQGADVHLAPGQDHHLPHEAWHVVQQKQGRVAATRQLKSGTAINDDAGLEAEADAMGARALATPGTDIAQRAATSPAAIVQRQKKNQSTGKKRKAAKEKKAALALDRHIRDAVLEDQPEATDTFHDFGDDHRDVDVDPDATGGAHGVRLSGGRPEDAPIVERFRQSYNRLDSWAIYLQAKHPDIYATVESKFHLDRRHEITGEVKALTKAYKDQFRDLDNLDIEIHRAEFETAVHEFSVEIDQMTNTVSSYVAQKHAGLGLNTATVHEEGTEIWQQQWKTAVQTVNTILKQLWGPARKNLDKWVEKQKGIKTKVAVGDLTYIGSLAKAYKGPPKQHIRFNPSDFDVDANLDAPSLAEYAMRVDKLTPDRGRIFGRLTTIKPLIAFCDQVQAQMIKRVAGIEDDPGDQFDIVIMAHSTIVQDEEAAAFAVGVAARDQRIG